MRKHILPNLLTYKENYNEGNILEGVHDSRAILTKNNVLLLGIPLSRSNQTHCN